MFQHHLLFCICEHIMCSPTCFIVLVFAIAIASVSVDAFTSPSSRNNISSCKSSSSSSSSALSAIANPLKRITRTKKGTNSNILRIESIEGMSLCVCSYCMLYVAHIIKQITLCLHLHALAIISWNAVPKRIQRKGSQRAFMSYRRSILFTLL